MLLKQSHFIVLVQAIEYVNRSALEGAQGISLIFTGEYMFDWTNPELATLYFAIDVLQMSNFLSIFCVNE